MTRCAEFYEKWEQDPNWCSKCDESVRLINNYLDLTKEFPTMVGISERAARPLFEKRYNNIRGQAIKIILDRLGRGEHASYRDVKIILRNLSHDIAANIRQVAATTKPIIRLGDFRELCKELPDNSIDCILTDPPYSRASLALLPELAAAAKRLLKPSGFLISYQGWEFLPDVVECFKPHLSYYWVITLLMDDGTHSRVYARNIFQHAKPIMVYQKEPVRPQPFFISDVIENPQQDKELNDWGQGIVPLMQLLERFTVEGDTVLDPMAGAGSTVEACIKTNRKVTAFEINAETYSLLTKRFGGAENGQVPSEQHT